MSFNKGYIMKFLIAVFALASSHSFACSLAPTATAQLASLNRIISSEAFRAELREAQKNDFHVSITRTEPNGSEVTLSNGCGIVSKTIFAPVTHPGMCPEVQAVVSETFCQ